MTITGLKPETSYEVKLSAINGKGEGESSLTEFFKTKPVSKWHKLHSSQHTVELSSDLLTLSPEKYFLESSLHCLDFPLLGHTLDLVGQWFKLKFYNSLSL